MRPCPKTRIGALATLFLLLTTAPGTIAQEGWAHPDGDPPLNATTNPLPEHSLPASTAASTPDLEEPASLPAQVQEWVYVKFPENMNEPVVVNPLLLEKVAAEISAVASEPDPQAAGETLLEISDPSSINNVREPDPSRGIDAPEGVEVDASEDLTFALHLDTTGHATSGDSIELLVIDALEDLQVPGEHTIARLKEVVPPYSPIVTFPHVPSALGAKYVLKMNDAEYPISPFTKEPDVLGLEGDPLGPQQASSHCRATATQREWDDYGRGWITSTSTNWKQELAWGAWKYIWRYDQCTLTQSSQGMSVGAAVPAASENATVDPPKSPPLAPEGEETSGGGFSAMSSSSTTIASHNGIVFSAGAYGDTGTLITFSNVNGNSPVGVTYKYCYWANSNGRTAQIRTLFDGVTRDAFSFTIPYTGGGTCNSGDANTFASRTFTIQSGISSEIRFDYTNGDFRIAIADIVVTAQTGSSNSPPNTPSQPSGSSSGTTATSYWCSTSTTDPDGDNVRYEFSWGDGSANTWTNYVTSGSSAGASKSWSSPGTYYVFARAHDPNGGTSGWSPAKTVTISSSTTGDAYEPDNSFTQYTWITPSTAPQSQSRSIDPTGDEDYIRFSATAGRTYTFYTEGSTDTYGHIYTSSRIEDAANDDAGAGLNFHLTYTPSSSGDHYLKIRGYNSATTGPYTLYYSYEENTANSGTEIRPSFGFGFGGENEVFAGGGRYVTLFGGTLQGDESTECHRDSIQGRITSCWGHVARIHGARLMYKDSTVNGVEHLTVSMDGLAVDPCEEGLSEAAKFAITIAAFKFPWLGFATLAPSEYCPIRDWEPTDFDGQPGLGADVFGVGSVGEETSVSGDIKTEYTKAGEFRAEMRGAVEYSVWMQACRDCSDVRDSGGHYYDVTPLFKAVR